MIRKSAPNVSSRKLDEKKKHGRTFQIFLLALGYGEIDFFCWFYIVVKPNSPSKRNKNNISAIKIGLFQNPKVARYFEIHMNVRYIIVRIRW